MAKKKRDLLCKSTVEEHTEDMVRFFYPNAELIFDFNKGFELLDIELADILPDNDSMKDSKTADKILKLYTLTGEIVYLIINIEFQSYHDPTFAKRLFTYFYRLLDKYGPNITILAIYTDQKAQNCSSSFNYSLFNTNLTFNFKPYKVWEQNEQELLKSNNPYAFIILTMLLHTKAKKNKEIQHLEQATKLANELVQRKIDYKKKVKVLNFMKLYLHFANTVLRLKFDNIINTLTIKSKTMGIFELEKMFIREESLARGSKTIQVRVAKNLLQMNVSLPFIQKATELPLKKIIQLQRKHLAHSINQLPPPTFNPN